MQAAHAGRSSGAGFGTGSFRLRKVSAGIAVPATRELTAEGVSGSQASELLFKTGKKGPRVKAHTLQPGARSQAGEIKYY